MPSNSDSQSSSPTTKKPPPQTMRTIFSHPDFSNGALALLIGAAIALAILTALGFGKREIWSSFQENGSNVFRGLVASGMAGGIAAAVAFFAMAKRDQNAVTPADLRLISPAACALAWGILGLSMHVSGARFLDFLPRETVESRNAMAIASSIFLSNGAWQSLSVALGLLLSTIGGWIVERRFAPKNAPSGVVSSVTPTSSTRLTAHSATARPATAHSAEAAPSFRRNMSLPILVAIPGLVLLGIFGLAIHFLPQPNAAQLPSTIGRALLSALVCALSFGVASFGVRRIFGGRGRENSLAYVLSAPTAIAFVCAMFLGAGGQMPIMESAVNTIWNASPFEAASWGAFGSALGFWLAGRKVI